MENNQKEQQLQKIRHSLAHLMAYSVKQLFPGSQNAIGPAIENGFYQDFEITGELSEGDLPKIEKKMREVLRGWAGFERREVTLEEALEIFSDNTYKQELAREFSEGGKTLTIYTSGDFVDLCKGGHADDISTIDSQAFKLTSTAGAYWKGDEKNIMLTRIYGLAFNSKEELEAHLNMLEEAKARDHRKLGKELDLYTMSPLVGTGLPLFTPRGTVLREKVAQLSNELREVRGFTKVWTPNITKTALYEKSGHWAKFGDELFLVTSQETDDKMALKPMNCPHHAQIYISQPRSYRDMPVRFLETTIDYRDEKTGELGGLNRVRSITQDDSHVFARPDQIEQEIDGLLAGARELYRTIGMRLRVRLSYRDDSDAYLGDAELWASAQQQLKVAVEKNGLDFFEEEGEAAFYGPKIDFMATDAIGREHQVATVQLDFVQPERFELEYVAEDGSKQRPVMIHCALLGSIERFLSVYIEHTGGWFDFWSAPEQVRILTINDTVMDYVEEITSILSEVVLMKPVKYNEVRFTTDDRNESLGKKIREATRMKIPLQLIIGPKDKEARQVSVRTQSGEEKVALGQLAAYLEGLAV